MRKDTSCRKEMPRAPKKAVIVILVLLCCRSALPATAAQTSVALEKAKAFLYSQQKNGNWEEVSSPTEDFKDINGRSRRAPFHTRLQSAADLAGDS